jgi:hypothetical protein
LLTADSINTPSVFGFIPSAVGPVQFFIMIENASQAGLAFMDKTRRQKAIAIVGVR